MNQDTIANKMTTLKELKEKEKKARRQIIIDAAQGLFSGRDFRQVTVREIAKKAGVSPGTIYRYYKNMDELFLEIFLLHITEICGLIDSEVKQSSTYSVKRFSQIHVEYLNEHMAFYQMMSHFMLSGALPGETSEKMNPVMRKLLDLLEKALIESGLKTNTRYHAHALFAALNGTMISFARYPGRSSEEIKTHTLKLAEVIAARFSGELGKK